MLPLNLTRDIFTMGSVIETSRLCKYQANSEKYYTCDTWKNLFIYYFHISYFIESRGKSLPAFNAVFPVSEQQRLWTLNSITIFHWEVDSYQLGAKTGVDGRGWVISREAEGAEWQETERTKHSKIFILWSDQLLHCGLPVISYFTFLITSSLVVRAWLRLIYNWEKSI